jgi:hypothetical protein
MEEMKAGMTCKCPHHKMLPLLVVLFGLNFLLGTLSVITMRTESIIWPIIVIVAGLMKMSGGACKCCSRGM